VVLKGHRTLIATPDDKVFINPTGNAGMATGGTGDVLTGMIAGWLGQLLDAEAACKLAVYLHGMAGDLAETELGEVAMTSADVSAHLGAAIQEITGRRRDTDASERRDHIHHQFRSGNRWGRARFRARTGPRRDRASFRRSRRR
jgi:hydroxyethylthiazole kinase-like sugar kinase family protein